MVVMRREQKVVLGREQKVVLGRGEMTPEQESRLMYEAKWFGLKLSAPSLK